jgi:hypothetical protein
MRLCHFQKQGQRGHVLFISLVTAGVIGIALCAYLNLIGSQNNFNARSQTWNLCMPIVEAGIEEALAHLNTPTTTNLATQGWSWDGTAVAFTKQRAMGSSFYLVQIDTNSSVGPIITCTGYVPAPVTVGTGANPFAALLPAPGVAYISRKVRVTTRMMSLFCKALVAKNTIDFNGNNTLIDSYDSSVPPYTYNAATARDNGDVTAINDTLGSDSIGNAKIKGHLLTGPNASLRVGPNAVVGSVGWHAAGNSGIQPGWLKDDASIDLPDVQPPWTSGTAQDGYAATSANAKYQLTAGNYEMSGDCTIKPNEELWVSGKSSLWIKGTFSMSGTLKIFTNASFKLYLSGNLTGPGNWDKSSIPADFVIYGLPTCTQITLTTGKELDAAIYAPQADLVMNGTAELCGATVSNTVKANGNAGYHFDESLASYSGTRGYVVNSWQEL